MVLESHAPFNRYFVPFPSRMMLGLQVMSSAHFLQPGNRPLKLEPEPYAAVHRLGRQGSCGNKFNFPVIEFIHKIDESASCVLLLWGQRRNTLHEYGVELPRYFHKICRTPCFFA